jgi:branched-chain amino acid transport system ATP-binding protein
MPPLLQAEGISAFYGRVEAVHDVSLKVEAGQIATIIGTNGAGKTTLLHALMGLVPCRGTIEFVGTAIGTASVEQRTEAGLSLVPETRALFTEMTVLDNLELGAFPRYRRGERRLRSDLDLIFSRFPRLAERRKQRAGTLSGGERQMLAIGRALMARPKLLMLDEPSLGLAPLIVREVFKVLEELRNAHVALLLVEQNAHAALRIADYAYVIDTGTLALEGPAPMIAANPLVVSSYLGVADESPSDPGPPRP